jgi:hypothetical protein
MYIFFIYTIIFYIGNKCSIYFYKSLYWYLFEIPCYMT